MKKYLIYIALLVILVLPTYAADLEVVCDNNVDGDQCNIISGDILFNETNWYPGGTIVRTIKVTNNDKNDDCRLKMFTQNTVQNPNDFASNLFTAIESNSNTIYGSISGMEASNTNNLQNIFDASNVSLGNISNSGGINNYSWYVTFNPELGNEYQGANVYFDFKLQFKCDHDESNNDTNNDNTNNNGGEVQGIQNTGILSFFGSILGNTTEETQDSTESKPEVQGTSIETTTVEGSICKDSPFWGLLFVAQFILLILISALFKNKKTLKNILKLITTIVFIYVFSTYVCIKWDIPVSIVISLLSFLI